MKTVSLKLAKQLKDAGFPQETAFYWMYVDVSTDMSDSEQMEWRLKTSQEARQYLPQVKRGAAPLVEEILEQLPWRIDKGIFPELFIEKTTYKTWIIAYKNDDGMLGEIIDKSLAEAAGKMWLYLKKEGLV